MRHGNLSCLPHRTMSDLFETIRATIEAALDADDSLTLADVNLALDLAKADLLNVILTDDDDSEPIAA